MIGALARKFFGSANDRRVKGYQSRVSAINALEPELVALSDEALKARTAEFRAQLADGKSLDDLLVPAFATVREAAKRTLGQRHFDVQLIGGMVLHEGKISEMKTGEGKTLVSTLPVYLSALEGKGVHVVTVNDYLAKRDAEWMGQIYHDIVGQTLGAPDIFSHAGKIFFIRHRNHPRRHTSLVIEGLIVSVGAHGRDARPVRAGCVSRLQYRTVGEEGCLDPVLFDDGRSSRLVQIAARTDDLKALAAK